MPEQTQEQRNNAFRDAGLPVIDSNTLNSNQNNLNVATYTEPPIIPPPQVELGTKEKEVSAAGKELIKLREQGLGESGLRAQLEQEKGIAGKEKTVSDLESRLTALTNEAIAIPLQLQEESKGRGRTVGGLAPIEMSALRKNTIQTLQTQSALAGAQGNLTLALDLVDRAVATKFDPIKEQIKVLEENIKTMKEDPELTAEEKARLDIVEAQNEAKKKEIEKQEANEKSISEFSIKAIEAGADSITANKMQNARTPLEAAIIASEAGLFLPEAEKLDTDVVKLDNGNTVLINTQSGEVIKNYGGAKPTIDEIAEADKKSKELLLVNDINNVLDNPDFDNTFGLSNYLKRKVPGSNAYALEANVNNILNQLALAARGQLKGQGTVSDFEGKMLKDAQTALKINMNPEQARKELVKIRGAIRTSSGLDALIKVTDENGNTDTAYANSEQITKMIEDGYNIEYTDPTLLVNK